MKFMKLPGKHISNGRHLMTMKAVMLQPLLPPPLPLLSTTDHVYQSTQQTFHLFVRSFIHSDEHANPHVVYRFRFGPFLHFQNCNTFSPVVLMIKCRGQMNSSKYFLVCCQIFLFFVCWKLFLFFSRRISVSSKISPELRRVV